MTKRTCTLTSIFTAALVSVASAALPPAQATSRRDEAPAKPAATKPAAAAAKPAAPAATAAPKRTGTPPPRQGRLQALDDRIYREVRELFRSYELRNIVSFRQIVSTNFRAQDDFKFGTSGRQMTTSVGTDLQSLRNIQFDIEVYPPVYNATYTTGRVAINWFRRASFNASGEEWIVRDQNTVLQFDLASQRPKLMLQEGDPVFGLSNQLNVLLVDRGTINGTAVVAPQGVRNGRLGAGLNQVSAFGNFRRAAAGGIRGVGPFDLECNDANTNTTASLDTVSLTGTGAPSTFRINTVVFNLGAGNSGPTTVTFACGSVIDVQPVANVPPGGSLLVQSRVITAAEAAGGIAAPTSTATFATVDSPNLIVETNEANNSGNILVFIVP